ncbi:tyrosine-type recombinase/integrase [Nonomuraea sp. NPDC050310]|uniref:tyrosine-type recombinase/integrase n=1 Tax=Nonomuraea sp. NPDC050310 TaxID=3154935 RepID=UPI0033FC5DFE
MSTPAGSSPQDPLDGAEAPPLDPSAAAEPAATPASPAAVVDLTALTGGAVVVSSPPRRGAPTADDKTDDEAGDGEAAAWGELIPLGALPVELPPKGTSPPARTATELAALLRTAGAGERLLQATGGWLMSERRASPATQQAYIQDVSWWLWWVQARGLIIADVDFLETDLYAAAMRHADWASATRARRLSAVRSWYGYLMRAEAAQRNPFDGMELPKVRSKVTRHLTGGQLQAMLSHALAFESVRTQAIIATLLDTGCRISELLTLTVADFGYNAGERVLNLRAKGDRVHQVVIGRRTADLLDTYVQERGAGQGPLFISRTGLPLRRSYVLELVQRLAGAAGIEEPQTLGLHSIRHSVAADLAGHLPLEVVQRRLGHADPRTTQRYTHDDGLHRDPARHADRRMDAARANINLQDGPSADRHS